MPVFRVYSDGYLLGTWQANSKLEAYQKHLKHGGYSSDFKLDGPQRKLPDYINLEKMTAFDVYDAVFDSANDFAENTTKYIDEYCWGVWEIVLTQEILEKIVAARNEYLETERFDVVELLEEVYL